MKTLKLLLFFSCLSATQLSFAQKNAPVAGDAALLVDLLKKDYNSIDPSTREDELAKDRALVIATFKAYMTEKQRREFDKSATVAGIIASTTKQKEYKTTQQKLTTLNSLKENAVVKDFNEAKRMADTIAKLTTQLENKRELMYIEKYETDNNEMECLRESYKSENKYAEYIISQFKNKFTSVNDKRLDGSAKSNPNSSVQKAIPFLGGDMGFEVVIEGLSKFLAKRIKEELTTHVIDKVKEWLKNPGEDDPLAELKVLLPRTNNYLLEFKASQVTSFPNEIKQYIEDDFNHIIENMGGLRNTPRIQRAIAGNPDLDFALEALELIPTLSKIKDPIDYFETLESSRNLSRWRNDETNPVKFNIAAAIQLSSMLAHSLTIIESGQPRFAGSDFINTYGADLNFYLLYVGFLHQQNNKYYNVRFIIKTDNPINLTTVKDPSGTNKPGTSVDQFIFPLSAGIGKLIEDLDTTNLKQLDTDRKFFETTFTQIGKNAEKVYASALEIKKANKKGDKIGADTVYTFVKSIIELAEEVTFAGDTLVNYLIPKLNLTEKGKSITAITIDYTKSTPTSTLTSTIGTETIKPFKLKEKAKPYFKVANTTNEIVLDLQKKKYATAVIKALELTAGVIPNKLTQSITAIPNLQNMPVALEWHAILPLITGTTTGTSVTVNAPIASSATLMEAELNKISIYYQKNSASGAPMLDDIKKLIVFVGQMKTAGPITFDATKLPEVKALLSNSGFHKIVISYYAGISIDELATKLENELNQATFRINDEERNVFTEQEAEDLKIDFLTYVDAAFQYLMDNNPANFNTANTAFKNTVTALLLRAPEKFNLHINERVLKLIHFVNDMAVSQNSDDVAKAIEAFALPAGSYSIKRDAIFNVSINSYPGILPSCELTWKKSDVITGSFSPAFTVPVGLSLTWSGNGHSHGMYIPIIDVGSYTRMHLDSDTASQTLPEFNFTNLFSPGLYYHWGFKKTPLSLHIGAQYGPNLKQIKSDGSAKIYESIRIGAGLVIDIPLLNLHTKPRLEKAK
jgi:hypothetical protein